VGHDADVTVAIEGRLSGHSYDLSVSVTYSAHT
jgi:hypothetical protein